jgi:cellulose synthase/poly-beta-1,6-N-acetylglucosamine synthase-like glycosyltransferase
MNALLIISGAFGLFRKDAIIEVGGFRTDTVGEDMELIVRLHRHMRLKGKPYRIVNVPDPICWTEAPEDIRTLKKQRMRWQRGLSETLTMNMSLLFNPRGGTVSWIAFPFYVIFEWLGPVIEVGGYVITIGAFFMGFLSAHAMSAFFVVAVGFGIFLSVSTLLMEGISFHIYPGLRHLLLLVIMAFVENLGYRQMNSLWRLAGLISWAFGLEKGWQKGNRKATWQQN